MKWRKSKLRTKKVISVVHTTRVVVIDDFMMGPKDMILCSCGFSAFTAAPMREHLAKAREFSS